MIIIANIVALLALAWWLSRVTAPFSKLAFWITLTYKLLAGYILGVIYIHFLQSGDTILYFEEAQEIAAFSRDSLFSYFERLFSNSYPQYKGEYRTEFFAKILSFFMLITGNNYWLSSAYLSLFSFTASWFLVLNISKSYQALKWPAFIGFLIIPSIVFWSSGILKESVANAGFFLLGIFLISFYNRQPISLLAHILYALVLILVIKLRFYLGAVMVIAISFLIISRLLEQLSNRILRYALIAILTATVIMAASFMDYNLQFKNLPESIHYNYETISKSSVTDNFVSFNLSPNWLSLVINSPKSLIYGLFGPFPGQGHMSSTVYWLENMILLFLAIWSVFIVIRDKPTVRIDLLFAVTVSYILVMAVIFPMLAPNFGTLMRYKSAFLPLLWTVLLSLPWKWINSINAN